MMDRALWVETPEGRVSVTADRYDVEGDFVVFRNIDGFDNAWVCTIRADRVFLIRPAEPEPAAT